MRKLLILEVKDCNVMGYMRTACPFFDLTTYSTEQGKRYCLTCFLDGGRSIDISEKETQGHGYLSRILFEKCPLESIEPEKT
jgi:hypothetical protein